MPFAAWNDALDYSFLLFAIYWSLVLLITSNGCRVPSHDLIMLGRCRSFFRFRGFDYRRGVRQHNHVRTNRACIR